MQHQAAPRLIFPQCTAQGRADAVSGEKPSLSVTSAKTEFHYQKKNPVPKGCALLRIVGSWSATSSAQTPS